MITIEKSIIHILDGGGTQAICSDVCSPCEEKVEQLFIAHIEKIMDDGNVKICSFSENSEFVTFLHTITEDFENTSKKIAEKFFNLMQQNATIPSGDLVLILAQIDQEKYLVLLKMNYRESFVHFFENTQAGIVNRIVPQQTALPSFKNKIEEATLINLHSQEVKVIEKAYEIDGMKSSYLSEHILNCAKTATQKQKFNQVKKIIQDVAEKYAQDQQESSATHIKLYEELAQDNTFTVSDLCEKVCVRHPHAKEEIQQLLEKKAIDTQEQITVTPSTVKRLSTQAVKNTKGVEIKIPVHSYDDVESVEFIQNPDGSISLLIKNIVL